MHILFITPGFAKDESDTTCLPYFQNYLLALRKSNRDCSFSVLSLDYPFSAKKYYWHTIEIHSVGGGNKPFPWRLRTWYRGWEAGLDMIRGHETTVIHSLWLRDCCLLGGRLANKFGLPHVCTAMGTDVLPGHRYLALRHLFNAKFVYVSEFQRKNRSSCLISDGTVIPWGLPYVQNAKVRKERPYDILFVASFAEVKELATFLKILKVVDSLITGLTVHILGEDFSNGEWARKIEELNLAGSCRLWGLVENDQVIEMMSKSKVLVHPASYESQGYVFLEALAQGMHIVSRKVGVAQAGSQWHIADQVDDFVETIKMILQKEDTEYRSIQSWPITNTVTRYLELYNSLK